MHPVKLVKNGIDSRCFRSISVFIVCFILKNIERCLTTECSGHTYGLECSRICGNCRDWEECDYLNGSCPNGCNKGTMGIKCDIDMTLLFHNPLFWINGSLINWTNKIVFFKCYKGNIKKFYSHFKHTCIFTSLTS